MSEYRHELCFDPSRDTISDQELLAELENRLTELRSGIAKVPVWLTRQEALEQTEDEISIVRERLEEKCS